MTMRTANSYQHHTICPFPNSYTYTYSYNSSARAIMIIIVIIAIIIIAIIIILYTIWPSSSAARSLAGRTASATHARQACYIT